MSREVVGTQDYTNEQLENMTWKGKCRLIDQVHVFVNLTTKFRLSLESSYSYADMDNRCSKIWSYFEAHVKLHVENHLMKTRIYKLVS